MELSTVGLGWPGIGCGYCDGLAMTGNCLELFFDFIVVGCGGVKCKVKLEPLEISSHLL